MKLVSKGVGAPGGRTRRTAAVLCAALALLHTRPARADDDDMVKSAVVTSVTFGVSMLVGGGFLIAKKAYADSADADAEKLASRGYDAPCESDPELCASIDHDLEAVDDSDIGIIASFSTAGIAAGLSVYFIVAAVTDGKKNKERGAVTITPVASPDSGGAVLSVAF